MTHPRTVLFVCLHGAAKSVLAAADFERLARARGLDALAESAGTEPDPEIAPRVLAELRAEGVDLRGRTALPGLADIHAHLAYDAGQAEEVEVRDFFDPAVRSVQRSAK